MKKDKNTLPSSTSYRRGGAPNAFEPVLKQMAKNRKKNRHIKTKDTVEDLEPIRG